MDAISYALAKKALIKPPAVDDVTLEVYEGKARIKDGGITKTKLAAGIMSSKLANSIPPASITLDAGAKADLVSLFGNGMGIAIFYGNGDATLNMIAVTDEGVEDIEAADKAWIGSYAFSSSLKIQVHNPNSTPITATYSGVEIRGVMR